MEKYIGYVKVTDSKKNAEIVSWINTTLAKRIKKKDEDQSEIEHILDYLQSPRSPSRLQKMSYEQAKSNTAKWLKSLTKKGANLVDNDQDIKIVKRYKSGLRLVRLVSENAYRREGTLMGHCVAGYYGKDSIIYSLRDFNNEPHCTIEVTKGDEGKGQQIKGKGNGSTHPKYIKTILAVLKYFKLNVRGSELGNMGYVEVFDKEKDWLDKTFKGAQYLELKGVTYFYKYSTLLDKV